MRADFWSTSGIRSSVEWPLLRAAPQRFDNGAKSSMGREPTEAYSGIGKMRRGAKVRSEPIVPDAAI
ncbi:hypothetical protein [uncultured Roseobacter sp.]|uniref:hypothetical protein n=1 Tax=uncultured Roseobacter sp. TaxID=114847 RepID=UPI00260ED709|nr:hypothetical protein [uncultured Roseobacter sp.]